jgi:hypothetical protein
MGAFISGILRGIRPLADGETVYYRWLDFDLDYGIQQAIFDDSLITTELHIGERYEMLLTAAPMHYSLERPIAPEVWIAQIINLTWHLPFTDFSHVSRNLERSRSIDFVLLAAPFGQMMTTYGNIQRRTRVTSEHVSLGAFISWEKDIRISLAAVV